MAQQRFEVRKIDAPLGADVFGFPFADFTDDDIARMRKGLARPPGAALPRHRHRRRSADSFFRQARTVRHPSAPDAGRPAQGKREILVVSNLKRPMASRRAISATARCDGTPTPGSRRSRLRLDFAREAAADRRQHLFCNMYRAYETLPAELKKAIDGKFIHHQTVIDGRGDVRMGMTRPENPDPSTWPGVDHPIVRTHGETGRKAMYLGGSPKNGSIVGMPIAGGTALLEKLWAHVGTPDLVWAQEWRKGDMVMWDNRCVMHRRDSLRLRAPSASCTAPPSKASGRIDPARRRKQKPVMRGA